MMKLKTSKKHNVTVKWGFTLAEGGHSPLFNGDFRTQGSPRLEKHVFSHHKKGFTLAEVLITLGVIGVVAAVTLPTLVQNYKKQVATARLKNFYSTMQQAILMSEAVNGPSKDWEFSRAVYDSNGVYDSVGNRTFVYNFISKYLLPYMNYDKITKETNKDIELYFKDASVIKFGHGSCIDLRYDINGTSNPNIIGRDIFTFVFCFPATDPNNPKVIGFHSYDKFSCKTRQTALEKCKTNINYCSTLLQYDNWEFKDDYPYKL